MRYFIIFIILFILLAGAGYLIYNFVTTTITPNPSASPTIAGNPTPKASGSATPIGSPIPSTMPTSGGGTGNGSNGSNGSVISDASNFQSGVVAVGRTKTIKLFATPNGTATKMNLRLRATNMEIVSYTAPDRNKWTVTKSEDCSLMPAGTYVCQDLEKKSGTITYGESIGEVKVKFTGLGDAYLEFITGNGYFVNNILQDKVGKITNLSVVNASDLPSTAIVSDQFDQIVAGLFILIITAIAIKMGLIQRFALWATSGLEPDFSQANTEQLNFFSNIQEKLAVRRMKANAKRNMQKLSEGE